MVQTQLSLPDKLDHLIDSIAVNQGKRKEDIIIEAVKAFVQRAVSPQENLNQRREAMGMWQHRTDLPNFDELRGSMDRMSNWSDDR